MENTNTNQGRMMGFPRGSMGNKGKGKGYGNGSGYGKAPPVRDERDDAVWMGARLNATPPPAARRATRAVDDAVWIANRAAQRAEQPIKRDVTAQINTVGQVRKDGSNAFSGFPLDVRRALFHNAVKISPQLIANVPPEFLDYAVAENKEPLRQLVVNNGSLIRSIKGADEGLMLDAVNQEGCECALGHLTKMPEFIGLSPTQRDNIHLAAVKQDGGSLCRIPDPSTEMVRRAVISKPSAMGFVIRHLPAFVNPPDDFFYLAHEALCHNAEVLNHMDQQDLQKFSPEQKEGIVLAACLRGKIGESGRRSSVTFSYLQHHIADANVFHELDAKCFASGFTDPDAGDRYRELARSMYLTSHVTISQYEPHHDAQGIITCFDIITGSAADAEANTLCGVQNGQYPAPPTTASLRRHLMAYEDDQDVVLQFHVGYIGGNGAAGHMAGNAGTPQNEFPL